MTIESLEDLFTFLEAEIEFSETASGGFKIEGCDGTHRVTRKWAASRGFGDLKTEDLLARLAEHGGNCCDCEVLLNAEPQLCDALPSDEPESLAGDQG